MRQQARHDHHVRHGAGAPSGLRAGTAAQPVFRPTRALEHDSRRPAIDPGRVGADWALMYHWLQRDPQMADVCGFQPADLAPQAQAARIAALEREVGPAGRTFTVRPEELRFWVRFSWIGSDRCSGRQHALQHAVIRHLPHVTRAEDMLRAAVDHAAVAMDAPLAPQTVVTVLGPPTAPGRPGQLFATEQLLRPAGYRRPGGTWHGDGGYLELTDWVRALEPGLIDPAESHPLGTFDTLPMVAVGRDGDVAVGTCPPAGRHLVDIPWPRHPDEHPDEQPDDDERDAAGAFACWPAVPLQTNFALDIAGQRYCVLFNGWYVDEEIAANFLDPARYDWAGRVSAAIHSSPQLEHLRRTDRLDEYRLAQVEIATLRAVRRGFRRDRRRLNTLGPSQRAFGKFHERYVDVHGQPPPNDTGWTANRLGSRYRHSSHAMPHVPQTQGAALVRHWLTFRSLRPDVDLRIVDLER